MNPNVHGVMCHILSFFEMNSALYVWRMGFNHREQLCYDQDVRYIIKATLPVHDPLLIGVNKLPHIVINDCSCGEQCSGL